MSAIAAASVRHFALIGTPNSGKTALFNALTGSRQKVANYPGVTVERKSGALRTPSGLSVNLIDLPGTYSLRARSPDEEVTRDVVLGRLASENAPDLLVCVADATNLRLALRLVLELKQVGRPLLLGAQHDRHRAAARHGDRSRQVVGGARRAGDHRGGGAPRRHRRSDAPARRVGRGDAGGTPAQPDWQAPTAAELRAAQREADRIIKATVRCRTSPTR